MFRPIANVLPDEGVQVTVGMIPELSVAVGFCQVAKAVGSPGLVAKDWLTGQDEMLGASISVELNKKYILPSALVNYTILDGLRLITVGDIARA